MKLSLLHYTTGLVFLFFSLSIAAQADMPNSRRDQLVRGFESGKVQFGVGLSLKVDLVKNTFGYYRLSLTGGAGLPVGKEFQLNENYCTLYYFAELDLFRGGVGAPALALDNQKILMELRQSFLTSFGVLDKNLSYNYTRPLIQFVSNSSHPVYDPYRYSVTLGTTFVNGLNVKRSQRVGIISLGCNQWAGCYMNDGPPFSNNFLPYGDGFDRWWTGSGMIGFYDNSNTIFRSVEIKYDKFTGLQPYAYETSNSLKLKYIPYKSKTTQLLNRQRLEISGSTARGIGFSMSFYDLPLIDVQHYIHFGQKYSYHNTPLKWRFATGLFYNNTYHID